MADLAASFVYLVGPVELGFRDPYGAAVFLRLGPGGAVAAREAEDAAAEYDEHLVRRAEVAVPAALEEQAAQGLGQFARTIGGYLRLLPNRCRWPFRPLIGADEAARNGRGCYILAG